MNVNEPIHDTKSIDTSVSGSIGRIKVALSNRRKKKLNGQGGTKGKHIASKMGLSKY